MIRSSFNIGCSESKVISSDEKQQEQQQQKKRLKTFYRPLQGANVRTSSRASRHAPRTSHLDTASQHTEKPAVSLL